MIYSRSKIIAIGSLLIIVLSFFVFGGLYFLKKYQQKYSCYDDRPPLRSFEVIIDPSQSQELVEQLQIFANKNNFSHQISYYSQDGIDFSFWMEREDLEVITRSPFTRGEFRIGFYNNDCVHPTEASDITGLVEDLKNNIIEIPNVNIIEENK